MQFRHECSNFYPVAPSGADDFLTSMPTQHLESKRRKKLVHPVGCRMYKGMERGGQNRTSGYIPWRAICMPFLPFEIVLLESVSPDYVT